MPVHNSFSKTSEGGQVILLFLARNYKDHVCDPIFDPNRHARAQIVRLTADGPYFGVPEPDTMWTPKSVDVLPPDGGALAGTAPVSSRKMA